MHGYSILGDTITILLAALIAYILSLYLILTLTHLGSVIAITLNKSDNLTLLYPVILRYTGGINYLRILIAILSLHISFSYCTNA